MSKAPRIKADRETKDETKAGSYFVSNYPPFAFWNDSDIQCVESMVNSPKPSQRPLGLYYHVPFCRKRCHFCYFRVYTDKSTKEIRRYLAATLKELQAYADSPYLQGRKPEFVYFGGGTPSSLSVKDLISLTDEMKRILPWDKAEEVTFECEPGTLTEKKLEAIKNLGVTRLSLGIENFKDHILEINGRAHRSEEVFKAYEFARGLGFDNINVDLIAGMLEETDENWSDCIDRVIDLSPDCVTIYQMEVPFNTGIYKTMKEQGSLTAPIADWQTKRRWVKEAFERLESEGYSVTSAYTAVKNPKETKFVYRDSLWTGADMVALGVASFGHLGGIHYQNLTHLDQYCESIETGKPVVRRALLTNEEELFVREIILQWKLGRVYPSYFQEKFGIDVQERYAEVFEAWEKAGDLEKREDELRLSRDALLRVDSMLYDLFLPRHKDSA